MRCGPGVPFKAALMAMECWMQIGTSSRASVCLLAFSVEFRREALDAEDPVVVLVVVEVLFCGLGGRGRGVHKKEKTGFGAFRPKGRCTGRVGSPTVSRCRRLPTMEISNASSTTKRLRPETSTVRIAGGSPGERPPTE